MATDIEIADVRIDLPRMRGLLDLAAGYVEASSRRELAELERRRKAYVGSRPRPASRTGL